MSFTEITKEVQEMPFDEKIQLQYLLEQYIIEERRNEIYKTYQNAKELAAEGKLKYSSDIGELRKMLDE
jgi:hypothetical protein